MISEIRRKTKGLVGSFIRTRRETLGMSRAELTEIIGCSPNLVGMIERGKTQFPFGRWKIYADALGVPRHEFLQIAVTERYPECLPYLRFVEACE
ncbi:MAG: helix-turn-helix transcriptional regulator [Syntrophobacteraceae bacterium]|jgi:transcriptional regulator with XRE-family HTH domain